LSLLSSSILNSNLIIAWLILTFYICIIMTVSVA
jgi:hypothetical protein